MLNFVDLDRTSPNNWLNDANLWMRTAYHQIRAPLPIHSNWWLLLQDDPNVPLGVRQGQADIKGKGVEKGSTTSVWQVRRAAWLVSRFLEYREKLEGCVFIYHVYIWFVNLIYHALNFEGTKYTPRAHEQVSPTLILSPFFLSVTDHSSPPP